MTQQPQPPMSLLQRCTEAANKVKGFNEVMQDAYCSEEMMEAAISVIQQEEQERPCEISLLKRIEELKWPHNFHNSEKQHYDIDAILRLIKSTKPVFNGCDDLPIEDKMVLKDELDNIDAKLPEQPVELDEQTDFATEVWKTYANHLLEQEAEIVNGIMAMEYALKVHGLLKREVSGWQPIETAPKDGTIIDLYGYNATATKWKTRSAEAFWDKEQEFWCYWYVDHEGYETAKPFEIHWVWTHWMPEPKPPTTQIEDDK